MNKIEGFEPEVNEEDRCPCGGGHEFILEYENEEVQILICEQCKQRSVGYYAIKDEETNETE
jgi:cytidine deaminase